MRKSKYIALSGASLLAASILLYYGIIYQGVMMSIVGATLLLQGLAIIATPLPQNNSLGENFHKRIITGYASNLEKLLISATGSKAFYVPFRDKVRVIVASEIPKRGFKIDLLLDAVGGSLTEKFKKELKLSDKPRVEEGLSKLDKTLRRKGLVEKIEYHVGESITLNVKKPATLELHKHLSRVAPKIYSYLGCPLTSAIVVLITEFLGKTLTADFKLKDDTVIITLKPANLNFTRVMENEEHILA